LEMSNWWVLEHEWRSKRAMSWRAEQNAGWTEQG
jgi:hypothetical protein